MLIVDCIYDLVNTILQIVETFKLLNLIINEYYTDG